jgi:hypothetical protein
MIHDTPQGEHMAIFSNDPNQGIRDAGMEQFIPPSVSSVNYKGNAGMNAKRAGSYTNAPSAMKKKAPVGVPDPSKMSGEQKASFMAKSGDSTRPSARLAPRTDRIAVGPGAYSTQAKSGLTLSQQVDGIVGPPAPKPNIQVSAALQSPEQQRFAEIRAKYDKLDAAAKANRPVVPTYQEPTQAELEQGRKEYGEKLASEKGNAIRWLTSTPEDRKKMTAGKSVQELAPLMNAVQLEAFHRAEVDKSRIRAESAAEQDKILQSQLARSARTRDQRIKDAKRDSNIAALHNKAVRTHREVVDTGRERDFKRESEFMDAMAESPVSKVFSRKNPFGAGLYNTGAYINERLVPRAAMGISSLLGQGPIR